MKETERRPKVTLEDLIQLKRAERPPAEFWPEFERTLRAKQLAAIVETRPWWRGWTARKALVRVCVPLGATALVAMTFGSFRGIGEKTASGKLASNVVAVQPPLAMGDSVSAQGNKDLPTALEAVASSDLATQDKATDNLPLIVVNQTTGTTPVYSTEQMLASSTATVKAAGQAIAQLVGLADSSNLQVGNARTAVVEPLTQVATPRDNRRTRLLAYSVSYDPHAADGSDAVRSRERITHRLSDDAVYDSITRLGLSGDRVSIKF
jgi:hypothetical protein